MSANNGGPAFPCETGPYGEEVQTGNQQWLTSGMTLRDYFAIRCMPISKATFSDGMEGGWDALASHAYTLADAMLKAREK